MKLITHIPSFLAALQALENTTLPLDIEYEPTAMLVEAYRPTPYHQHPFWVFEWEQLAEPHILGCTVALLFAGVLCSAGGIGGGGIYVTVLMAAGKLSPRDAVPLSKSIVFFGSMSSLALNLRRQVAQGNLGQRKTLIDISTCRIVVPAALAGTLMGVLINHDASDSMIIMLLSTILVSMTLMVVRTAWCQYQEESTGEVAGGGTAAPPSSDSKPLLPDPEDPPLNAMSSSSSDPHLPQKPGAAQPSVEFATIHTKDATGIVSIEVCLGTKAATTDRQAARLQDSLMSGAMLLIVVSCGVMRYHAGACLEEVRMCTGTLGQCSTRHQACHHPATFFAKHSLERWMQEPAKANAMMQLTVLVPMLFCLAVMVHTGWDAILRDRWQLQNVVKYNIMGLVTGCLAGLVGIGGGLIFSPFFLVMGMEPAVAVATSSTCVIFTSSSTTLQYLLTDRIIMSLTLIYGLVNLAASYCGTAFVHLLADRFGTRRSYITSIVALGVGTSALLSFVKLPISN